MKFVPVRMLVVAATLAVLFGAGACSKKRIDIRKPYQQRFDQHMKAAYDFLASGDLVRAIAEAKVAAEEARKYNSLDDPMVESLGQIDTYEANTIVSIALFLSGDATDLEQFRQELVSNAEDPPAMLRLAMLYYRVWYGNLESAYRKLMELGTAIQDTDPEAPFFYFVAGYAEFLSDNKEKATKQIGRAAVLLPKVRKLYPKAFDERLKLASRLVSGGNPALVCSLLCRKQHSCMEVTQECPNLCVDRLEDYQMLRVRTMRMMLSCLDYGCGGIGACIQDKLNSVYDELTEREFAVWNDICGRLCESNVRCDIIDTQTGLCKDICTRVWAPLGKLGIRKLEECFQMTDCNEAKACYDSLWRRPIHAMPEE